MVKLMVKLREVKLCYLFEPGLVLTTILDGWVGGFGAMETKTNLSQS